MRISNRLRRGAIVMLLVVAALGTWAAAPSQAQPAGVEPQADKLLRRMTDYLAGLGQFSVETRSTIEVVLASGQKLQFDSGASLSVQRPNKLFARRKGDLVNQQLYYDGRTLNLYNPDDKVYATVGVPGTIEAMLDYARESLDLVAPASDLVYRNAYEILIEDVTAGFVVGKAMVDGVRCDHLAFRKPEVDWQVWIQEGPTPLPRKFVITSKTIAGAPEFGVVITGWSNAPTFGEGTFSFKAPSGARAIDFVKASGGTK